MTLHLLRDVLAELVLGLGSEQGEALGKRLAVHRCLESELLTCLHRSLHCVDVSL